VHALDESNNNRQLSEKVGGARILQEREEQRGSRTTQTLRRTFWLTYLNIYYQLL
jgi:hypothetical protein